MRTLVWVEHDGTSVKDATLSAVTAASKLGEVHLLLVGQDVQSAAQEATGIAGVDKVHVADDAAYAHQLVENVAPLVVQLMANHDAFVAPATTAGKAIAPRVAALLDVMQISDILSVEAEDTFTRPIYAGNAVATVRSSDVKKVVTVRTTAFEKAARKGGSGTVEAVPTSGDKGLSSFIGQEIAASSRPELTSARVIVAGGARAWLRREVRRTDRASSRQAGRGCRRQPSRRGCGIRSERLPGRPDRQDRRS